VIFPRKKWRSGKMPRSIAVNLGGEGEVPGAINQQGKLVLDDPDWVSSREGKSIKSLHAEGHNFVISDNRFLPFDSVDQIFTNGVPIDGPDTWLGPPIQSSEIIRVLKPGGKWFRDGVLVHEKQ
jgi:hypothetical protein